MNLTAGAFPGACPGRRPGVSERKRMSSSQIEDSPPLAAGSFKSCIMRKAMPACICIAFLSVFTPQGGIARSGKKPLFIAHFMPWHQTPDVSGYWGYHWTMRHFNPDIVDENGKREIASHYYPLTGPYDSQDEDVLEYQVLLMKITGINGVLVDWYGMEDFWDYAVLNEGTLSLFDAVKRAGLLFAIVYEDQSILHMVENGHLESAQALAHGREVMQYMQENWFSEDCYLKLDGRPVLLTFGPQYFKKSSDWETLFSELPVAPLFFTLDNRIAPAAAGAYPWPPMWKSNASGILTQNALKEYLNQFYQKAASWPNCVAAAFPGFHDIYKEAGVSAGYGFLDPGGGETLRSTLQSAIEQEPDIVQLITWNDYGEGTMIEPTEEYGTLYLEIIQDEIKKKAEPALPFRKKDLTLPFRIFESRMAYGNDIQKSKVLDEAADFIASGDPVRATELVDSLTGTNSLDGLPGERPGDWRLEPNVPNPFNPRTTIHYHIPRPARVTLSVMDMRGRSVEILASGYRDAGRHALSWNTGDAVSGLYFIRMQAGPYVRTRKCVKLE